MEDAPEQVIHECATCGALIDVTEEQPLALVHCPTCGAAMRVRRLFDHFELQEVLGAGGMGAVYRALDTKLNRPVALKLLRSEHSENPELIQSFAAEAGITASINHPHVVKVYSTGTDHGVFYIAMELVDKGSLDDLMGLQGRVGEAQVLEVGMQIAQGLSAAYQRGLIHRDVKPGNILFADAHNSKIVDFGLAVLQENASHVAGEIWGTPYYVAPEKLDTPPLEDFRSDMYSLGATLFHALAGRPPFEAETASMVALKHLKSQAVSLQAFAPDVSSATTYVINKTLNKDPEQRYRNYEELVEHLEYARNELLEKHKSPQVKTRVVIRNEEETQAMSWVTFGMIAVIVIAGVLLFLFRGQVFDEKTAPDPQAQAKQQAVTDVEGKFAEARRLMIDGKPAEGAAALIALEANGGAPQPLRNWLTMNAGLAFLLAGQDEDAQTEFQKVVRRGAYTADPSELKLATFFVQTAKLAVPHEPIPASLAKDYDKATYEAFALFLFAVKDWNLSAFDEAGPLFRQFQSATFPPAYIWVAEYRKLVEPYVADFNAYKPVAEAVGNANTPESQKKTLALIRETRTSLKLKGKLADRIEEMERNFAEQVEAHDAIEAKHTAEVEAADRKALQEVQPKLDALGAAFKFAEAAQAILGVSPTGEAGKKIWNAQLRQWQALAQLKATLIRDINTTGYAQPLTKKNGSVIPDGLKLASETGAAMVTRYGNVPVLWNELAPASIVAMGQAFLKTAPPASVPDREWQLGNYLLWVGKRDEALPLLRRAAAAKPDYRTLLEGIPGGIAP
ncbi:MAG: Serine/threonine protein kinase [Chthoniobacter sp.]|nr:Serine/threonine protein kinase [Chthoniobacter sp.]